MDISKSIQTGLLIRGYKTKKAFCEDKGISQGLLTRVCKSNTGSGTNIDSSIGSLIAIARGFDVPVSTFIEWGEQ